MFTEVRIVQILTKIKIIQILIKTTNNEKLDRTVLFYGN